MGKYLISEWAICAGQPYLILQLNILDTGITDYSNLLAPTNDILPNHSREFPQYSTRKPAFHSQGSQLERMVGPAYWLFLHTESGVLLQRCLNLTLPTLRYLH